jgi:hypothetical protein
MRAVQPVALSQGRFETLDLTRSAEKKQHEPQSSIRLDALYSGRRGITFAW